VVLVVLPPSVAGVSVDVLVGVLAGVVLAGVVLAGVVLAGVVLAGVVLAGVVLAGMCAAARAAAIVGPKMAMSDSALGVEVEASCWI
jgi:hypothetical protein